MEDRYDIAELRAEVVREIGKRTSRRAGQGTESEELVTFLGNGRAFEIGREYRGKKRRRAEEDQMDDE
jgi:hypothetical protein